MLIPHAENQMSRALARLHAGVLQWDPLKWPMFGKIVRRRGSVATPFPKTESREHDASDGHDLLAPDGAVGDVFSIVTEPPSPQATQEEWRRSGELEDQLRHSRKMEEAGRLACGAVHDLGNLLTMIYGYSDLLAEQLSVNDRMRQDVALISSACKRAMSLTGHLLSYSRRKKPEVRALDLNRVITDFEPLLRGLVGRNIELVTALCPSLDHVRADSEQLERVIMNLVVNARDAMPDAGRLVIETSQAGLDEVRKGCLEDVTPGSYVLLTVSDTGTGMDEAIRGRLFDPFFTTKAPGAGTGLGLATVYDILKQSGGMIWVESQPGKGTTFRLALPRATRGVARELQTAL